MFNFKVDKKEKVYFRIFAGDIILLATAFSIMYIIEKIFPQYISIVTEVLLPILLVLYAGVAVSLYAWIIIRNKK